MDYKNQNPEKLAKDDIGIFMQINSTEKITHTQTPIISG
jgi:hypothetical protein